MRSTTQIERNGTDTATTTLAQSRQPRTTSNSSAPRRAPRKVTYTLWTMQGLLALLFLFAGSMKLIMPIEAMTEQMPFMPGWFLQFIGVAEVLGGLGLVLPGLFRIRQGLTPLAAACLVIIMIGATVLTAATGGVGAAIFPFVVGILLSVIAYGRWQLAPRRATATRMVLNPAL